MDMDRIQFPLPGEEEEEEEEEERRGEERRGEERRGEVLDHSQAVHWSCKAYSLTSDIIKTCVCVCVCVCV